MTTTQIRLVQQQLAQLGWTDVGPADGIYGPKTKRSVVAFQQSSGLTPDGIVGPKTRAALAVAVAGIPPEIKPLPVARPGGLRGRLIEVAEKEVGVVEVPNGSNGGPRVDVYTNRWRVPWCALWLSWCVKQVDATTITTSIPSVVGWRDWFTARGRYHLTGAYTPIPGDAFLMLYQDGEGVDTGHGHIGIVRTVDGASISSVEGNSGNGVRTRTRTIASLTSFGVIFP